MSRPSRRRPDGPEDANPLNRRLPAEVISRRRPTQAKESLKEDVEVATVVTDLKQVLAMKGDARAKWLTKGLQQAQDGKVSAKLLYDVLSHPKFANDLHDKVGARMYRALHGSLSLFSAKQQRFLESDCALASKYAATAFGAGGPPGQAQEDAAPQQEAGASAAASDAAASEEMMKRCQAFVLRMQAQQKGEGEAGQDAEAPPAASEEAKGSEDEAATEEVGGGEDGEKESEGGEKGKRKEPEKAKAKESEKDKKEKPKQKRGLSSSSGSESAPRKGAKGKADRRKRSNSRSASRRRGDRRGRKRSSSSRKESSSSSAKAKRRRKEKPSKKSKTSASSDDSDRLDKKTRKPDKSSD